MARILRIDDAIIYQDLLRIAFQSPKIGEAFARLVAAQLSGLALSAKLRVILGRFRRDMKTVEMKISHVHAWSTGTLLGGVRGHVVAIVIRRVSPGEP